MGMTCIDANTANGDAAPIPDAAANLDAAALPADVIDAATTPFCTTLSAKPLLCDDFENGPLPSAFSSSDSGKGGTIGLELPVAGPGSRYLFSMIAAGSANGATAFLEKSYAATATDFSLAFAVRIGTTTPNKGSDIARIIVNGDGGAVGPHHLIFNYYNDHLEIAEQFGPNLATYYGHLVSASPKVGEWARVAVHLNVATHKLEATLNGASILSDTIDASWIPASHRITFGISYAQDANKGWRYDLDDVVYDAK